MATYKENPATIFLVFSLALSTFAVTCSNSLLVLFSVDIASTFAIQEGAVIQLKAINSMGELIFALMPSFIALRVKHKSMLNLGLILVAFSAIGSYFAATFYMYLFCSFIEGIGSIMVIITVFTLTGDYFHFNPKAKIQVVSIIVASSFLFSLVGLPITNLLAQNGGWRNSYLYFIFPIAIISLVLSIITQKKDLDCINFENKHVHANIKKTLFDKSILSCLMGWLLFAGTSMVGISAIAFYRQHFFLSPDLAVLIILAVSAINLSGTFTVGKFGKYLNIKLLTVAGMAGSGLSVIFLFLSPSLTIALIFNFTAAFFMSIATCSYNCLILDQLPELRRNVVSLSKLFFGMGTIIFTMIAGYALTMFSIVSTELGYRFVGVAIGLIVLIGALIILFYTKDRSLTRLSAI
jgi:predicted MFS family arabinose efflux permease